MTFDQRKITLLVDTTETPQLFKAHKHVVNSVFKTVIRHFSNTYVPPYPDGDVVVHLAQDGTSDVYDFHGEILTSGSHHVRQA